MSLSRFSRFERVHRDTRVQCRWFSMIVLPAGNSSDRLHFVGLTDALGLTRNPVKSEVECEIWNESFAQWIGVEADDQRSCTLTNYDEPWAGNIFQWKGILWISALPSSMTCVHCFPIQGMNAIYRESKWITDIWLWINIIKLHDLHEKPMGLLRKMRSRIWRRLLTD